MKVMVKVKVKVKGKLKLKLKLCEFSSIVHYNCAVVECSGICSIISILQEVE